MNGSGRNVAGCASCSGNCCRRYRVGITIADIQRLAEGTGLHPNHFVRLMEDDDEGFKLKPGGPTMSTYLIRRKDTGGCQFLMEIAPGKARCGVYAHRPLVCSNFPTMLSRGSVSVRQDTVCGEDAWNLAAMDVTGYRRDLTRDRSAWAEHRRMMTVWNSTLETTRKEAKPDALYDFMLTCT